MKFLWAALLTCFLLPENCISQTKLSPADSMYQHMMSQINAKHVRWIKATAKEANAKNLGEPEIRKSAASYTSQLAMSGLDIEALIFLVMMQISKDAYGDIRDMMKEMDQKRKRKDSLRNALETMKEWKARNTAVPRYRYDSLKNLHKGLSSKETKDQLAVKQPVVAVKNPAVTAAEIQSLISSLEDQRDSLNEQSEQMQLKMQMMMDRMTKADTTASTLMKKFSETASQITGNLK